MIGNYTVLNGLRQLMTLDEKEAENALPLCSLCLNEIKNRLREGADENDSRIASCAAALAFYRIAIRNAVDSQGTTSFKAGDVTVSRSPAAAVELAVAVRDEAFAAAADLIEDSSFVFRQVGV